MRELRKVETRISLAEKIRCGERRWVSCFPQFIFKARKFLVEDSKVGCFVVHNILIGRNSQFGGKPVPLEVFAGKDAETNFETCQVGMVFEVLVENVSSHDLGFGVVVVGDTVDE